MVLTIKNYFAIMKLLHDTQRIQKIIRILNNEQKKWNDSNIFSVRGNTSNTEECENQIKMKVGDIVNINKLRGKMVEKEINVERLAKLLNTDRSTLYRKLNSAERITIGEATKIKSILELTETEAIEIFFN